MADANSATNEMDGTFQVSEQTKPNDDLAQGTSPEDDGSPAHRTSSRERKPTEKMQELQNEEQKKREHKFNLVYEKWKMEIRSVRISLRVKPQMRNWVT